MALVGVPFPGLRNVPHQEKNSYQSSDQYRDIVYPISLILEYGKEIGHDYEHDPRKAVSQPNPFPSPEKKIE